MVGDVIGRERLPRRCHCARRKAIVPSKFVAVTTQRSPFLTQLLPAVKSRLFWRVTTSSPTPADLPVSYQQPLVGDLPLSHPVGPCPALSSVTVAESPAIIRLDLPASMSFFQAA